MLLRENLHDAVPSFDGELVVLVELLFDAFGGVGVEF